MSIHPEKILQDVSHAERMQQLANTCDTHEQKHYVREFSQEELLDLNKQFSSKAIQIKNQDLEIQEKIKLLKEQVKAAKKHYNTILEQIRTGQEWRDGILYTMYDHEKGDAVTYDEFGNLISVRKLRPEERQLRLRTAL